LYGGIFLDIGKRLLWFVVGSCFAGLALSSFSAAGDNLCKALLSWCSAIGPCSVESIEPSSLVCAGQCSLAWIVLSYCQFRRRQWARWLAAVLLTVIAILLMTRGLFTYVEELSSSKLEAVNPIPMLLLGIVFAIDGGILTFSEVIADFFASGHGAGQADWSTVRHASNVAREPVIRAAVLAALPGQETMLRRSRRFIVVAVALAWMISIGFMTWGTQRYIGSVRASKQRLEADRQAALNEGNGQIHGDVGWGLTLRGVFDSLEQGYDLLAFFVAIYVVLFVMPSLLALPLVFRFARRWRDPIRFLVLRPFNNDHVTKELSALLRDEFARFGHCYTLSDRRVRVPLHVRVPLLLGQLSFFNYRVRKIRRPRHIDKIARGMHHRIRRNINWCLSTTKLFPISCCDAGWRACVRRLVQDVDIVIVDVSNITGNVLWELEYLRDAGALSKTVLVSEESRTYSARQQTMHVLTSSQTVTVMPYGRRTRDTSALQRRVLEILCDHITQQGDVV
jgi:hypothetical protein